MLSQLHLIISLKFAFFGSQTLGLVIRGRKLKKHWIQRVGVSAHTSAPFRYLLYGDRTLRGKDGGS